MSEIWKRIRIEQSLQQIEALATEIDDWLKRRRAADSRKQYETQFQVLEKVLTAGLDSLRSKLEETELADGSEGFVYASCAELEKRLLLNRRLWLHFRQKFDQRDDPILAAALSAADEIVWSCFKTPFDLAGVPQPSAPLAFVSSTYSPEAHQRNRPPPALRKLESLVEGMPMPVVSLPPSCVINPWWLVFLAHEVGHQVQYDLAPKYGLVESVQQLVEKTAREHADPGAEPAAWRNWAIEIFADAYSILMVGPWALWAMADLARVADPAMLEPSLRYPPPLVRLNLMSAMLDELGFDSGEDYLRGLDPLAFLHQDFVPDTTRERLLAQMEFSKGLAAALLSADRDFCGLGSLPAICGWEDTEREFEPNGTVSFWREVLKEGEDVEPEKSLAGARLAISAATAAWADTGASADGDERKRAREDLASAVLELLPLCREVGTRSAEPPPAVDLESLAEMCGRLLLEVDLDDEA